MRRAYTGVHVGVLMFTKRHLPVQKPQQGVHPLARPVTVPLLRHSSIFFCHGHTICIIYGWELENATGLGSIWSSGIGVVNGGTDSNESGARRRCYWDLGSCRRVWDYDVQARENDGWAKTSPAYNCVIYYTITAEQRIRCSTASAFKAVSLTSQAMNLPEV
jgi:hypothetical protein